MEWSIRLAPSSNAPICDIVWSMPADATPTIKQLDNVDWLINNQPGSLTNDSLTKASVAVGYGAWRVESLWQSINGRAEPIAVVFSNDGQAVTATNLRQLPLGEILAESRQLISKEAALQKELLSKAGYTPSSANMTLPVHIPLFVPFAETGPRRGQPLSGDDLRLVAEIYKAAYQRSESVQRAVADAFHIAPSTATKRIMAARKAGLLDGIGPR